MAFHTFDPTPTDGGTFEHSSTRFDWCKITNDKFLIVYQQINPTRIYAQIVTFNGADLTGEPTYGTAYAVVNETFLDQNTPNHARPKIAFAEGTTYALLAYSKTLESSAEGQDSEIAIIALDVNTGSDLIKVVKLGSEEFIVSGTTGHTYHDIEFHGLSGATPYFKVAHCDETNPNDINISSIYLNTSSGIFTSSTNTYASLTDKPFRFTKNIDGDIIMMTSNNLARKFTSITTNYNLAITNSNPSQCVVSMGSGFYICSDGQNIRTYNNLHSDHNDVFPMMPELGTNAVHQGVRLDAEHVFFLQGRSSNGSGLAYIHRLGATDANVPFYQYSNENGPFTINNIPYDVNTDPLYPQNSEILYYDAINNHIRMIGIVDVASVPKITFQFITPN